MMALKTVSRLSEKVHRTPPERNAIDYNILIIGGSDEPDSFWKGRFKYKNHCIDGCFEESLTGASYLSRDGKPKTLYKCGHYSGDSLYPPDTRLAAEWSINALTEFKECNIETRTLESILRETAFCLLKIDVQGAELDVLNGDPNWRDRFVAVELECDIVEFYKGAPKFGEKIHFMQSHGYNPYAIERIERWRDCGVQHGRGRVVSTNILYVREPNSDDEKIQLIGALNLYSLYNEISSIQGGKYRPLLGNVIPFRETIGNLIIQIGRSVMKKGFWLIS